MSTQEQQLEILSGAIQPTEKKTINPPYGKTVDFVILDEVAEVAYIPETEIESKELDMFAVVQSAFLGIKECLNTDKKIKHKIRDVNFLIQYNSTLFNNIDSKRTTPKQNTDPDLFDIVEAGLIEIGLVNNGNFDKKIKQKKINKLCDFYSSFFNDINKKADGKIIEASEKLDAILTEEANKNITATKKTSTKPTNKQISKPKSSNIKDITRTKSRGRG